MPISHICVVLLTLYWLAITIRAFVGGRATTSIASAAELMSESGQLPRVSIILAVRNEQQRIEQTVERLLSQVGVEIEIIIVDDQSPDDTRQICSVVEPQSIGTVGLHRRFASRVARKMPCLLAGGAASENTNGCCSPTATRT